MKTYRGIRDLTTNDCTIHVIDDATGDVTVLPWRLDLRNHSPTGLEWGYGGSGPAQAALAILADAVGDERALRSYQAFKFRTIVNAPREGWSLPFDDVLAVLTEIEVETARAE